MTISKSFHRLENIDALRGICVVLVLLSHLTVAPWLYGRIGVAAFFLVSGYVIPFSLSTGVEVSPSLAFWIKRFFRLWPAYWVAILFAILLSLPETQKLTWADIVINLTMLQSFVGRPHVLSVFWTLQVELCFYFLMTVLIVLNRLKGKYIYFVLSLVFMLLALVMALCRYYVAIKLPVALPIALSLMFFSASCRMNRLQDQPLPYWLCAFILAVLIPTCLFGYADATEPDQTSIAYILAYATAMAVFLVFEKLRRMPKPLIFLGTVSYSFYLLHVIVIFLVDSWIPGLHTMLRIALTLLLSIAVASLCYFCVERPAQNMGNQLLRFMKAEYARKAMA